MKRISYWILLVLILASLLSACAPKTSAPTSPEAVASAADNDSGGCGLSRPARGSAATAGMLLLALAFGIAQRRR